MWNGLKLSFYRKKIGTIQYIAVRDKFKGKKLGKKSVERY